MKVAVIGLGYVGIPVAAVLASKGVNVVGVDIDPRKVDSLSAGESPLTGDEPGLSDLVASGVRSGKIAATLNYVAVEGANAIVVSVETPIDHATHDPNYRALKSALRG
ncbi:MAG TPA: 3-hydroxyacyl-CoA dehydrogenase NAD-binding domain-containing protein, partial [Thermoplasmata archaeon]|nr:3-hydroxyacyl-CoA dehydrogenase NAD-binding domain-containing protein [Thermoplasmata archaeon]